MTFGWRAHAEYLWPFPVKIALELFHASARATGITQGLGMRNNPETLTASTCVSLVSAAATGFTFSLQSQGLSVA